MIDWILGHLPLVIALATFFAGWLAQQRKKSVEADLDPRAQGSQRSSQTLPPPLKPTVPADDQIRRIQEEIRRKIQERTAGGEAGQTLSPFRTATPTAPPVVKPRSAPQPSRPVVSPKRYVQPKSLVPASTSDERETENLRRSEERRRETRKTDQAAVQVANAAQAAGTDGSNFWTNELRNPANLRKALVLREVLGPPVSMRR